MNHLDLAKARLNRAIQHWNELTVESGKFLANKPFDVVTEKYVNNGAECIRFVYVVHQNPPLHLGVIAGDCIHNLRAVMDNLVWGLGQARPSGELNAKPEKLFFPVHQTQREYDDALNRKDLIAIKCFPQGAQDLIESLQPFNGTPLSHRIGVLHKLWNDDKHKSPALMGGAGRGIRQTFGLQQPASLSAGLYIQNGLVVGYGTVPKNGIPEGATVELLDIHLLFPEDGPATRFVATELLQELIQIIHSEVICKFQPFF